MTQRTYGPHDFWSDEKPPAPSQIKTIAALAVELLDEEPPATRRDASVLISRLQLALSDDGSPKNTKKKTRPTGTDDIAF